MHSQILHIITSLYTGGAENMLYKLLSRMVRGKYSNQVVSLTSRGPTSEKIEALDIDVQTLNIRKGIPDPSGIWKLRRLIQQIKPDLIQTWMYHADLIGGLATRYSKRIPMIWNIRHSNLDSKDNKKRTIWTAKTCAFFSKRIPDRIICCSEASKRIHEDIGYDQSKILVIPNGFDLKAFQPNSNSRDSICHELSIDRNTLLLGMVARFNPQKDHHTLVRAVGILKEQGIDFRIILCGKDIDWDNAQLTSWIKEAGLEDRFFLLGPRDDIPRITAALDVAILSSAHGEGFPNVLGEAMACEVPCVATDVGDSAAIVGDTGFVVPSRDPEALAGALKKMVDMGPKGRAKLGKAARERVKEHFELSKVVERYEELYKEVLKERVGD